MRTRCPFDRIVRGVSLVSVGDSVNRKESGAYKGRAFSAKIFSRMMNRKSETGFASLMRKTRSPAAGHTVDPARIVVIRDWRLKKPRISQIGTGFCWWEAWGPAYLRVTKREAAIGLRYCIVEYWNCDLVLSQKTERKMKKCTVWRVAVVSGRPGARDPGLP